jgi:phosphate acetyltransferase
MLKRQAFLDHKVDVLGVVLDKVPAADHAILTSQLRRKFSEAGLLFAGGIPQDPVLERVRWVAGGSVVVGALALAVG